MRNTAKLLAAVVVTALSLNTFAIVFSASAAYDYTFPVIGQSSFSNDFDAPRSDGKHNAIDIIANKHQKIVSATNGTITYVAYPQPSWGYMVEVRSDSGFEYDYIHMNNDNPGTDDGAGGGMHAYAPDVKEGNRVVRGQLLGWVGDSGNAENTVSHLHFEVRDPNDKPVNPYYSLKVAKKITQPANYGALAGEILPIIPSTFKGGVNIDVGDIDNNGTMELAAGQGYKSSPRVRIFSQSGQELYNFFAFDSTLRKGVDVALGDVNGDGKKELIAAAVTTTGPRVAAYELGANKTVNKLFEFGVFGSSQNLVSVAAGNLEGDSKNEIAVGSGPGATPEVDIFSSSGTLLRSTNPYPVGASYGVNVAIGDVRANVGAPLDELVVAPESIGTTLVEIYDGNLSKLKGFYAYGSARHGLRVSVGDIDSSNPLSEIVTMPYQKATPTLKRFSGDGQKLGQSITVWEPWWLGYYDVAADTNYLKVATGLNRRGSIR